MAVTAQLILKTYPELMQHIEGDLTVQALAPCSQTAPTPQAIAYISDEKYLEPLLESPISILVLHTKLTTLAKQKNKGQKTLLSSNNPYLCIAVVNKQFFSLPHLKAAFDQKPIHPNAVIAATASLGKNVVIGPGAVIGEHVIVGDNTYIGANTVIETDSQLGANCYIHSQVYIGHTCRIGQNVEIKPHSVIGSDGFGYAHDKANNHYRIPHYGAIILEDDVHIGANVNIDRGTFDPALIGAGTKIDNHCHFGHNVKIGKNCLITAGFIVAGSSTIGDNCVFGGRVSVNGHITICDNCTFGPLSTVTNHVTKPGVYAGFPVIDFRDSLKAHASFIHLPKMRKNISKLMKHLGLNDEEKV